MRFLITFFAIVFSIVLYPNHILAENSPNKPKKEIKNLHNDSVKNSKTAGNVFNNIVVIIAIV